MVDDSSFFRHRRASLLKAESLLLLQMLLLLLSAAVYTNQTVTYNFVSSTTLDAYLQINTQAFSVSESTTSTQVPNLSCSYSGSTSIVFSLSSYNGANVPSFVSIDSATGVLTIVAPSVSSSTAYSFYITSTISGMSGPVQKILLI